VALFDTRENHMGQMAHLVFAEQHGIRYSRIVIRES
jgi:hypothetical protein